MHLAVFGSGRGSNFQAIHKAIQGGYLDASISVVVVNKRDAPMIQYAQSANIPVMVIPNEEYQSRKLHEDEIISKLDRYEFDLIVLAGYMRILSPEFVTRFKDRIINIHPSLLPSFPGLHAQKQALEYGVKVTGVTVHLVNEEMDQGKILAQICVEVKEGDTVEILSERILKEEHKLYAKTIQQIITGDIKLPVSKVM